jgi:calcineurin-like phosphoesterase family protein
MNTAMIERWNAVIQPKDEVWHLGDFAYKSARPVQGIFSELNGHKHLILGNHDAPKTRTLPWASVSEMKEVLVDGQRIFLCHYPMLSWPAMNRGSVHLHGHVHGNSRGPARSIDVGVDDWDFRPVSLPEILERIDQRRVETLYTDQPPSMTPSQRRQTDRYVARLSQISEEEPFMSPNDLIRTALDTIAHVPPEGRRDLKRLVEFFDEDGWEREAAFKAIGDAASDILEKLIQQRIDQKG